MPGEKRERPTGLPNDMPSRLGVYRLLLSVCVSEAGDMKPRAGDSRSLWDTHTHFRT